MQRAQMDRARNYTAMCLKKKLMEKEKRETEFADKLLQLKAMQDEISRSEQIANFALDLTEHMSKSRDDSVRAEYEVRKQECNKFFADILKTDIVVIETEKVYKEAVDDYEQRARLCDEVLKMETPTVSVNTAASRKSRAKWRMSSAKLSFDIAQLNIRIGEASELKLFADTFVREASTNVAHLAREPQPMVWDWVVQNDKMEEWKGLQALVMEHPWMPDVPVNVVP